MMGKNVLVTGGAGFIGSHLVDRLLNEGHTVSVIDNLSTGRLANLEHQKNHSRFKFVKADIADFEQIHKWFKDQAIVFHLAALADIVPSIVNPRGYYASNVLGTMNVLEASRLNGIGKFVYSASASCYGIPSKEHYPTAETAPINTEYPYALTKFLGESTVFHWAKVYRLPVVSLRLFNVYGPRSRTSGTYGAVFGVFLTQKLNGKPYTVVGDGSQTRDFIYVSDVVEAFVTAGFVCSKEKNAGKESSLPLKDSEVAKLSSDQEVFNVGAGNPQSINKLVSLLGGEKVHIPIRPGEPACTWADIRKIKSQLGWEPKVSFEEGVGKILKHIEYWREAPVWTPESIKEATQDWFRYLVRS